MNENAHKPPIAPQLAPDSVKTKQCKDCLAILPATDFGLNRLGKGGIHNSCKACVAQYARMKRVSKYGFQPKEELVRSVALHNEIVLQDALSTQKTVIGFQPATKREFKVMFHIGSLGMKAMAIFDTTGASFGEWSYSNIGDEQLMLGILKSLGIRLEYTQAELFASKNVIYYF